MVQVESLQSSPEMPVRVAVPARQHAAVQSAPGTVILFRVKLVGLVDVEPPVVARLFNERRLGGGSGDFLGPISGIPRSLAAPPLASLQIEEFHAYLGIFSID